MDAMQRTFKAKITQQWHINCTGKCDTIANYVDSPCINCNYAYVIQLRTASIYGEKTISILVLESYQP